MLFCNNKLIWAIFLFKKKNGCSQHSKLMVVFLCNVFTWFLFFNFIWKIAKPLFTTIRKYKKTKKNCVSLIHEHDGRLQSKQINHWESCSSVFKSLIYQWETSEIVNQQLRMSQQWSKSWFMNMVRDFKKYSKMKNFWKNYLKTIKE